MNKNIRFALILIAVLAVIALAGGTAVWASPSAHSSQAAPAAAQPAAQQQNQFNGTAEGWNCGGVRSHNDTKNVCSVATVTTGSDGDVYAVARGNHGTDFKSGVVELFFTSGSAEICFSTQGQTGFIYFQAPNGSTWTQVATNISGGKACAFVNLNGFYAFGK